MKKTQPCIPQLGFVRTKFSIRPPPSSSDNTPSGAGSRAIIARGHSSAVPARISRPSPTHSTIPHGVARSPTKCDRCQIDTRTRARQSANSAIGLRLIRSTCPFREIARQCLPTFPFSMNACPTGQRIASNANDVCCDPRNAVHSGPCAIEHRNGIRELTAVAAMIVQPSGTGNFLLIRCCRMACF